jgi:hypothetical protein
MGDRSIGEIMYGAEASIEVGCAGVVYSLERGTISRCTISFVARRRFSVW